MNFLWITDPWNTLAHTKDTTLYLLEESLKLGHRASWCDASSIRIESGKVFLDAYQCLGVEGSRNQDNFRDCFKFAPKRTRSPLDFSQIQYRVDPPVDQHYLEPIKLLLASGGKIESRIQNPPNVLFSASEKLESFFIPELSPPTVVSSQYDIHRAFGSKEKITVLKPLNLLQSRGVELLKWTTPEDIEFSKQKIEVATQHFTVPVVQQRYFDEIRESGEQRFWFAGGTFLGAITKFPIAQDFRVDIDRGSSVVAYAPTKRDRPLIQKISKHLKRRKIALAAIDILHHKITDFNLTCPGMILEMERALNTAIASKIIKAVAKL